MKENRNRYEILLQVAEIGNISRAAELLNYTQSGISHLIVSLEQELGLQIFVRSKNGVSLTDKGKRLMPYVRSLVNQENNLKFAAYEMNHSLAGVLRIGSFSSASQYWMPDIIKYFNEHYKDVEIEILDGNYNEIREWIEKGQVDCGFLSEIAADGLSFHPLLKDPIYVVVPKQHPLARKDSVPLEEALAYPLIVETPGCDSDIQSIMNMSVCRPNISYSFRDDSIIFAFVQANLGITISQDLVWRAFNVFANELVAIPLNPQRERVIGLAFSKTMNSLLPNVFLEFMQERERKCPHA